jgi:hypothetical protein
MIVDNLRNRDPTHVVQAKYFTKQVVMQGANDKKFEWNIYTNFFCKPVKPKLNYWANKLAQGLMPNIAGSVFIETKWAGLPYEVSDYVEYQGKRYMIKSVEKDEVRVTPHMLLRFRVNPNTYWILELVKVAKNLDL